MGTEAEVIARGRVVTPDGVTYGEVVAADGLIVDVVPLDPVDVAGTGDGDRWVCPGFVELQINGSHGIDLSGEPERLADLARILPREGTTAFLPTIVTGPDHVRERAARTVLDLRAADTSGAVPLGLHLEGPLLSPVRKGAHRAEHLAHVASCPTTTWTPAGGVSLVTIAPELPGAPELIAELTASGVVVSLGHTDATAAQFQAGLDAGATVVTHLFNAMRPFSHRDPGPIGVVLADDSVAAGVICDGIHVDPVAVRLAWRALGPERLVLVTDAVAARGTATATHGIRLADGTLAGSDLHLDAALRNLVAWTGAPVPDAVRCVTQTPARLLGLADRGVLEIGHRADVVVLDRELRVVRTFVGGRRAA